MPTDKITSGGTTMTVLTPEDMDVREDVDHALIRDGAVLLRGLGVRTPEEFHAVVSTFGSPLDSYRGGNTPRHTVMTGVFTSTEYPAEYPISLHNELSYAHRWPARLFFCCLVPAESGGATPVCDGRAVLADLAEGTRDRFERRGVVYRQRLHGGYGFGKSWQDTYQTSDTAEVESFLRETETEFAWTEDGGLRTAQHRPAVLRHSVTGELVWFNQAEQWHPSSLPTEEAEALLALVETEADLPHSVTYGDGGPIDVEDLEEVRSAVRKNTLSVPWEAGDVLIVDNELAMHGREAFTGERRVLVSMT
ncbi:TauD/TfdA family dioxygenase [Nonomuraea aurantiaca]|uniref:TauD/TfdA family dioxygenase n=1 Tax=Nonomuraea aurantiaca TaxID=2878562 RepID=UPI001CD92023|nr:TauD/TfdA family dioxygenase [Nonomuraea aurantiaca]MCA2230002.1 TauD/TfdA family dioxygenase [Nonomuraea aurantiaca]